MRDDNLFRGPGSPFGDLTRNLRQAVLQLITPSTIPKSANSSSAPGAPVKSVQKWIDINLNDDIWSLDSTLTGDPTPQEVFVYQLKRIAIKKNELKDFEALINASEMVLKPILQEGYKLWTTFIDKVTHKTLDTTKNFMIQLNEDCYFIAFLQVIAACDSLYSAASDDMKMLINCVAQGTKENFDVSSLLTPDRSAISDNIRYTLRRLCDEYKHLYGNSYENGNSLYLVLAAQQSSLLDLDSNNLIVQRFPGFKATAPEDEQDPLNVSTKGRNEFKSSYLLNDGKHGTCYEILPKEAKTNYFPSSHWAGFHIRFPVTKQQLCEQLNKFAQTNTKHLISYNIGEPLGGVVGIYTPRAPDATHAISWTGSELYDSCKGGEIMDTNVGYECVDIDSLRPNIGDTEVHVPGDCITIDGWYIVKKVSQAKELFPPTPSSQD